MFLADVYIILRSPLAWPIAQLAQAVVPPIINNLTHVEKLATSNTYKSYKFFLPIFLVKQCLTSNSVQGHYTFYIKSSTEVLQ
jgi:hypothetical protein